MNTLKEVPSTTKYQFSFYGVVYGLSLSLLLLAIVISQIKNISVEQLTRDIAAIAEFPPYYGLVSNIGILLWCGAASICLFGFVVLRNCKHHVGFKKNLQLFLLFSGLITLFLMFDDLLMLHEEIFPTLKISEMKVYSSYAGIFLFYIWHFRKTILKTEWTVFGLGLLFLGASVTIDVLPIFGSKITLLEDGFKLLGIASWFGYFVRLCFQIFKTTLAL